MLPKHIMCLVIGRENQRKNPALKIAINILIIFTNNFTKYHQGYYIPEHWYSKRYEHRGKDYYLNTNHRYIFGDTDTVTRFIIKTPHKSHKYYKYIPFKGCRKIVRIILKDLLKMGLIEKV